MAVEPVRVPAFAVISGGVDGAVYLRQLLRAIGRGRLVTDTIVVVDRDPRCGVAPQAGGVVRVEVADWSDWLDRELDRLPAGAHLVPYHWAPHLLLGWLERQLARAGCVTQRGGRVPPRGLRYEGDTRSHDRALSHAGWLCPALCVEPAQCPHTRGPRDWSLCGELAADPGAGFDHALVFRSLHLVWGVATIAVADILAARDRILARLAEGPSTWLVATASHCHGLATPLRVEPRV